MDVSQFINLLFVSKMKNYHDCLEDVATKIGYLNWADLKKDLGLRHLEVHYKQAAKMYAQQVAKDALERSSNDTIDIKIEGEDHSRTFVDPDSILSTEIALS